MPNIAYEGVFSKEHAFEYEHEFIHNGFPIHVKHYGVGKSNIPLLFIGGAFQNIQRVESLTVPLSQHSWVIVVDTPGNGNTGILPHNVSFDFICEIIYEYLVQANIKTINIFGCSYGSIVAMKFAQAYAESDINIRKMVLASAMHRMPDHLKESFKNLIDHLDGGEIDKFASGFTNLMTNPEFCAVNKMAAMASTKLYDALINANLGIREQFKHNTMRILWDGETDLDNMPDVDTMVMVGEHDHFLPVEANQLVANAFKRSELRIIPKADHMAHVEQRKVVIRMIIDAIGDHFE